MRNSLFPFTLNLRVPENETDWKGVLKISLNRNILQWMQFQSLIACFLFSTHSFPSVFPFSLLKFECTRCTWLIAYTISHIAALRLNDRLNKQHKYLESVNIHSECRKDHSYVIKIPHSIFDDDYIRGMKVFWKSNQKEISITLKINRWDGSYMFYALCSFSIDPSKRYIWMKYGYWLIVIDSLILQFINSKQ